MALPGCDNDDADVKAWWLRRGVSVSFFMAFTLIPVGLLAFVVGGFGEVQVALWVGLACIAVGTMSAAGAGLFRHWYVEHRYQTRPRLVLELPSSRPYMEPPPDYRHLYPGSQFPADATPPSDSQLSAIEEPPPPYHSLQSIIKEDLTLEIPLHQQGQSEIQSETSPAEQSESELPSEISQAEQAQSELQSELPQTRHSNSPSSSRTSSVTSSSSSSFSSSSSSSFSPSAPSSSTYRESSSSLSSSSLTSLSSLPSFSPSASSSSPSLPTPFAASLSPSSPSSQGQLPSQKSSCSPQRSKVNQGVILRVSHMSDIT